MLPGTRTAQKSASSHDRRWGLSIVHYKSTEVLTLTSRSFSDLRVKGKKKLKTMKRENNSDKCESQPQQLQEFQQFLTSLVNTASLKLLHQDRISPTLSLFLKAKCTLSNLCCLLQLSTSHLLQTLGHLCPPQGIRMIYWCFTRWLFPLPQEVKATFSACVISTVLSGRFPS